MYKKCCRVEREEDWMKARCWTPERWSVCCWDERINYLRFRTPSHRRQRQKSRTPRSEKLQMNKHRCILNSSMLSIAFNLYNSNGLQAQVCRRSCAISYLSRALRAWKSQLTQTRVPVWQKLPRAHTLSHSLKLTQALRIEPSLVLFSCVLFTCLFVPATVVISGAGLQPGYGHVMMMAISNIV